MSVRYDPPPARVTRRPEPEKTAPTIDKTPHAPKVPTEPQGKEIEEQVEPEQADKSAPKGKEAKEKTPLRQRAGKGKGKK